VSKLEKYNHILAFDCGDIENIMVLGVEGRGERCVIK
jgi:hypothetical protein